MTTVADIQRALNARGENLAVDGDMGPMTRAAIMRVIQRVSPTLAHLDDARSAGRFGIVPADWMPPAKMQRVIVHWSAGANKASSLDKEHYHIMIEGDGSLVRGVHSIADNMSTQDGEYAAHTKGCNSGSIGVSLCGMAGAVESPFNAGTHPITLAQWNTLPGVLSDLCRRYGIPITPSTVLSHAEVQGTLGIKQNGKWDISRLPFDLSVVGAKACGDVFRAAAKAPL